MLWCWYYSVHFGLPFQDWPVKELVALLVGCCVCWFYLESCSSASAGMTSFLSPPPSLSSCGFSVFHCLSLSIPHPLWVPFSVCHCVCLPLFSCPHSPHCLVKFCVRSHFSANAFECIIVQCPFRVCTVLKACVRLGKLRCTFSKPGKFGGYGTLGQGLEKLGKFRIMVDK